MRCASVGLMVTGSTTLERVSDYHLSLLISHCSSRISYLVCMYLSIFYTLYRFPKES